MNKGFLNSQFNKHGFLHIKNFFSKGDIHILNCTANTLNKLPEVRGGYMKYFEKSNNNNERILARMENFINHEKLTLFRNIINNKVTPLVEEVHHKRMILFKDKINWKLPGGGSFQPHQDHDAWTDFPPNTFTTAAIFVDDSTLENGCLQVVKRMHNEGLLPNKNGCIDKRLTDTFEWMPLITSPTDLVLFDSYTPHMSETNKSDKPRRAFYLTYNPKEEGDHYEHYFKKKRLEFPPDFERDENSKINVNSKYNLANPMN